MTILHLLSRVLLFDYFFFVFSHCSYFIFFHLFSCLYEHFHQLFVCHNYFLYVAQVGALQDVRSELTKLRGVLFYKILEDLHAHLYNKGEYRYLFFP